LIAKLFDLLYFAFESKQIHCKLFCLHRGISAEACKNAGGVFYRTPCVTLKETVDNRPLRFDLESPFGGLCDDAMQRLFTSFVSASTNHNDFPFESTRNGCAKFCQSLPDYSSLVGLQIDHIDQLCTCIYPNNKLPSRDLLPEYAKASLPPFILTNQNGMSLGIRPNIECDASDDLIIESQVSDPNNPRQQFQFTYDGRMVNVRCPEKVLEIDLLTTSQCTNGVGLQLSRPIRTSIPLRVRNLNCLYHTQS
jgi:hypothetical protein